MNTPITLPWQDPLACAPQLAAHRHGALLYSAGTGGTYSYLCLGSQKLCRGSDLEALRAELTSDAPWYDNMWVGWLGYGLKNQLEALPQDTPAPIASEDIFMFKPQTIYRFDHANTQLQCVGPHVLEPTTQLNSTYTPPQVQSLHSNMTTENYLRHVESLLRAIRAGTCYQANLTRKFYGKLVSPIDTQRAFAALCRISPARYSAYIKADELSVLSSSPELFLQLDGTGSIYTQPIKGTVSRAADAQTDQAHIEALAHSEKDRAENLMIVDLMRNDLSRVCTPGTVSVDSLFDITTHAYIHHMSSAIRGTLAPTSQPLDAVMACFPPGSMTGAPKIKAMQLCSELEQQARGIYSGAIGMFGGDGSAHLSVVIRTLLMEGKQFEFQVGGGIVADSNPQRELDETIDKARGICQLLGIPPHTLGDL